MTRTSPAARIIRVCRVVRGAASGRTIAILVPAPAKAAIATPGWRTPATTVWSAAPTIRRGPVVPAAAKRRMSASATSARQPRTRVPARVTRAPIVPPAAPAIAAMIIIARRRPALVRVASAPPEPKAPAMTGWFAALPAGPRAVREPVPMNQLAKRRVTPRRWAPRTERRSPLPPFSKPGRPDFHPRFGTPGQPEPSWLRLTRFLVVPRAANDHPDRLHDDMIVVWLCRRVQLPCPSVKRDDQELTAGYKGWMVSPRTPVILPSVSAAGSQRAATREPESVRGCSRDGSSPRIRTTDRC